MHSIQRFILATLVSVALAQAQTTPQSVTRVLEAPIQPVPVTAYQVQRYMMDRIPKLVAPGSPEQWTREAAKLRQHILNYVAFHGWPQEWVDSPPRFEEVGPVVNDQGYHWRKLRF
jgi:hypothetical protein